jgi:hypothetical protein
VFAKLADLGRNAIRQPALFTGYSFAGDVVNESWPVDYRAMRPGESSERRVGSGPNHPKKEDRSFAGLIEEGPKEEAICAGRDGIAEKPSNP